MSNRWMRNSLVYLLIVIAVIAVFWWFLGGTVGSTQSIPINQVVELAAERGASSPIEIEVNGDSITVRDGSTTYKSRKESGITMSELLTDAGVPSDSYSLEAKGTSGFDRFIQIVITMLPFLITGGIATLASLDFLGFGLPSSAPSLGEMTLQAKQNLQAPWLGFTAFFTFAIMLSLLVFVFEGVRDAFDPRKTFVAAPGQVIGGSEDAIGEADAVGGTT